jgi:hypothetical protein
VIPNAASAQNIRHNRVTIHDHAFAERFPVFMGRFPKVMMEDAGANGVEQAMGLMDSRRKVDIFRKGVAFKILTEPVR